MNLTVRQLPRAMLFTLDGEVDINTSAHLETCIDTARRSLDEHLIFDVSRLTFLASSGLAVLLSAATLARSHGADVHLAGLQPRVARIFEITSTARAVSIHDHVEQALAAIERLHGAHSPESA
uniref:STAS domain-containing protein n=1 Tax=Nonomuraea sp. CA-252377 TaxID=3240003 RepID=UPI003F494452